MNEWMNMNEWTNGYVMDEWIHGCINTREYMDKYTNKWMNDIMMNRGMYYLMNDKWMKGLTNTVWTNVPTILPMYHFVDNTSTNIPADHQLMQQYCRAKRNECNNVQTSLWETVQWACHINQNSCNLDILIYLARLQRGPTPALFLVKQRLHTYSLLIFSRRATTATTLISQMHHGNIYMAASITVILESSWPRPS